MNIRFYLLCAVLCCAGLFTGFTPSPRCTTTLYKEFETTLNPGEWHGFPLGESSEKCAYVPKIIPLSKASSGAFIEKIVVQPESDGKVWNDVLRVSIPRSQEPLKVQIRIYRISEAK